MVNASGFQGGIPPSSLAYSAATSGLFLPMQPTMSLYEPGFIIPQYRFPSPNILGQHSNMSWSTAPGYMMGHEDHFGVQNLTDGTSDSEDNCSSLKTDLIQADDLDDDESAQPVEIGEM